MDQPKIPLASDRDGTSQTQRLLPALLTDYAAVDERRLIDQLALAHEFAKELKYFNFDNVEAGDWQGLINPDGLTGQEFGDWLKQIENFIRQPENYADDRYYNLHRPHFVLFLTFLQLLKNTQAQLNQLTARHLDFYYRKVLNFTRKPPQPDRVNILMTPSTQVNNVQLPAGTLLDAGKDSLGKDRVYSTDNDLVVNQAQIARLSSIYVNKQIIGIREARELNTGTKEDKVMAMLKMALGDPAPGDDLPRYPPDKPVDSGFLADLQKLVKFAGIEIGLYMELGELRSLIKLKNNRTGTAADLDWQTINGILTKAGKDRAGPSFALKNTNPSDRHFDDNLKDALGIDSLPDYFNTLPPVIKNITDLYNQRADQQVIDFIKSKLHMDRGDFNTMMQTKVRIDNEWQEIYRLLENAGRRQRKSSDYPIEMSAEPPDFDKIFQSALGTPVYPQISGLAPINNLDSFYSALLDIEAYFYMPLEDFVLLMEAANSDLNPNPVWPKVYEKLASAHQKKVSAARKDQLSKLRPADNAKIDPKDTLKPAVKAMQMALGAPPTDTIDLVNRIMELLPDTKDLSLLEKAMTDENLTDTEWNSVCTMLELAWRNRVPIPVAQTSNWLSLSAFSDALSAKASGGSDVNRWHTFGRRQAQIITNINILPTAITLGWAISSPLLCLAQGQRSVTLTLTFKAESFDSKKIKELHDQNKTLPFLLALSTAKGWLTVDSPMGTIDDDKKSLSWTLSFNESAAAISALTDGDSSGINAPWPILRLLLQPRWDDDGNHYITDYPLFQSLLLDKVSLAVDVKGLTECKLQNDDQTLPPGKPFEPFGSSPAIGSRLYFAHPELTFKKLDQLEITLPWMGVPSDLKNYYQNYSPPITGNSAFTSKIALVDQRLEIILDKEATLFDDTDAQNPATLKIANIASEIGKNYRYERQLNVSNDEEVTAWSRYWLLELSGCDFQHAAYPGVASAKAIELAAAIANAGTAGGASSSTSNNTPPSDPNKNKAPINPDTYKVNPPYTPKLKSFSLNYTASIELNAADLQNQDADQVYHLHPLGFAPIQFDQQSGGYRFLPVYNNEGELYIGLSGVQAPQTLSMLLQMAEGTANPDLEPAAVQWSVLNGNNWQKLDQGQLQQDTTNGLLQSGIIKLQLDTITPGTLLPHDLYWLRAAVDRGCDSVCDCIGIDTQAVTATFLDQDNADDHLNQPLPADTIQSLVAPIAGIVSVKQPYTSFAAKPKEQESSFNTRVSERLRHKQRAVNHWDYERLVLEQFPGIYKAKCIPASLQENQGQVTVVVIPDVSNRLPFNPFEPKAPAGVLAEIEAYLSAYTPLGAGIKVRNASYRPVRLRFAVQFQPGCDSGFYKQQLNEEINRFLSPWAYEQGKDIVIGGKIYANAIIDFIERRAYVDYVAHFKLFLGDENGVGFTFIPKPELNADAEGYAVTANRPDAVLVAARSHDFDLITEINAGEQLFNNGINYMKIELDFMVG